MITDPRRISALLLAAAVAIGAIPSAHACTTLCLRHGGRIVFGKNYDWNVPDGMVMVNKRGVERTSDTRRPTKWVSKYGSVTFNQYGRDNPSGGMNEAGLTIELMWVEGTGYPKVDARPAVGGLEWIQYQLDNSRTVAEVIATDSQIRVSPLSAPLHFLVADRAGNVTTIEFKDGKLVAHTGDSLPVAALTNDFYENALGQLKQADSSHEPFRVTYTSATRFVHAARRTREFDAKKNGDPVPYAFETLAQVAQKGYTQWSIVYEVDRGIVHFRTLKNPQIKTLVLPGLDFSCATPVMVMDLHENSPGDARSQLRPYTREANLALLRSSFSQTDFLSNTSVTEIERSAALPDATSCRALSPTAPSAKD